MSQEAVSATVSSETIVVSPEKKDVSRKGKITFESTEVAEYEQREWPETSCFHRVAWAMALPFQTIFYWLIPDSFKGLFSVLKVKDLPRVPKSYTCEANEKTFLKRWNYFKNWKGRMWFAANTCFWFDWLYSHLIWFIYSIFVVLYPLPLNAFIAELQPALSSAELNKLNLWKEYLPEDLQPEISTWWWGGTNYSSMRFRSNDWVIWIWFGLLILCLVLCYICMTYGTFCQDKIGMKMRVLLQNLIYKKIYKLSPEARKRHPKGKIMTLLASDCFRIGVSQFYISEVWTAFPIIIGTYIFLVNLLGYYVLFSIIIFVIVLFLLWGLSLVIVALRVKHLKFIDKRMGVMREGLQNILVVKLFNLQDKFLQKIFDIRKDEVKRIRTILTLRGVCNTIAYTAPVAMTLVTFIIMYFIDQNVDMVTLIAALTFFTQLRNPLSDIAFYSIDYVMSLVAMDRVEKFLCEEEKVSDTGVNSHQPFGVEFQDASFSWCEEKGPSECPKTGDVELKETIDEPFKLRDIDLCVKKGQLVMICGGTKSGKSSLLHAILGEMRLLNGGVTVGGKVSYCGQQPFIKNDTVLCNILAEKKCDEKRLAKVLALTCLNEDVEKFEGGLFLEAGENGETLSGGQKSRIALARAVYHDAPVLLFDNVLASLDEPVANEVLRECLLGYLRNENEKTIVMVTANPEYYPLADVIVVMKDGRIAERGSYEELVAENGEFKKIIEDSVVFDEEEGGKNGAAIEDINEVKVTKDVRELTTEQLNERKNRVTRNEERVQGVVDWKTVKSYLSTFSFTKKPNCLIGTIIFLSAIVATIIGVIVYLLGQYHASQLTGREGYHYTEGNFFTFGFYQNYSMVWNDEVQNFTRRYDSDPVYFEPLGGVDECPYEMANCSFETIDVFWNPNFQNGTKIEGGLSSIASLWVFVILVIAFFVVFAVAVIYFFYIMLETSRKFFNKAVEGLFKTAQSFFFTGKIGRMLSRLSLDITRSDYDLIYRMQFLATVFFFIVGIFAIVAIGTSGLFVPILIALLLFYFLVYLFFRKTAMELKRLEAITRSDVFHMYNQTLNGMTTIKAFEMVESFKSQVVKKINLHNSAFFMVQSFKSLIMQYLTFAGILSIVIICVFCILIMYYVPGLASDGELFAWLGLGISNTVLMTSIFGVTFYNLVTTEIEFNAIERLDFYGKLPREEEEEKEEEGEEVKEKKGLKNGEVVFDNFSMKYTETSQPVLRNISLKIGDKEKVCVTGRTGCGKTSLFYSLLKVVEGFEGSILLGGENVATFKHSALRENVAIVPQDPTIFTGTIRENIDPHTSYENDEAIWAEIDKYGKDVKDIVKKFGLDYKVSMETISLGELKVLSLLRALLKKNVKILLVDESTAIDPKIDRVVQKAISKSDMTVLAITHRMGNAKFYKKHLVIEDGKVKKYADF